MLSSRFLWVCWVHLLLACSLASASGVLYADDFTKSVANKKLWSGMVIQTRGGRVLYSKGFGLASHELNVPMRNDHLYPIGSNTKLFTAVAIWQLHARGKLNVYDSVAKYLNTTELGYHGTWCPRVFNKTGGGCDMVKIEQLLSMRSGVLGADNCAYPAEAWQQEYCIFTDSAKAAVVNTLDVHNMNVGSWSAAEVIRRLNILKEPLEFEPGTKYHYSNPGFIIAGYIVERVSGKPLKLYFQDHIFKPAGLNHSFYDLSNQNDGIYQGLLPYPSYQAWVSPFADAFPALDQDVIGLNASLSGGNEPRVASPNGPPYGAYVKTTRNMDAMGMGFADYTLGGAAGAMISTPQDMARWFRVLTATPETLGLSKALIKDMFTLGIVLKPSDAPGRMPPGMRLMYAQGILSVPDSKARYGVSHVAYQGSLAGFEAVVHLALHPTDPAKDEYTGVLGATTVPVTRYDFKGSYGAANNCSYSGRPVPQVLCDAKFTAPIPGLTGAIAERVVRSVSASWMGLPVGAQGA